MMYFANLTTDENRHHTIDMIGTPNSEEIELFQFLSTFLGTFVYDINRITDVNFAYQQITNAFDESDRNKIKLAKENVNRIAINYLVWFRIFLDHLETKIKRSEDAKYVECFKKAIAYAYDNCIEYRFVYRLRNYAQHCNIPISAVSRSLKQNGEVETSIQVNKSRLIQEFDGYTCIL